MTGNSDSLSSKDIKLIVINFVFAIVAAVIAAIIIGEGRFATTSTTLIQWVTLIVSLFILLVTVLVLVARWRSVLKILKELGGFTVAAIRRVYNNWQLVVALALLLGVAYGVLALTSMLWAVILTLAMTLAALLLARYCLKRSGREAGYRREFGGDLLEKIRFGYRGSPPEHGWRILGSQGQPAFRRVSYGLWGRAIRIESTFERAMDYDVKPDAEIGSLIEFAVKYEGRSIIYARLSVHREDSSESRKAWLAFPVGREGPSETSGVEWSYPVEPTRLWRNWLLFQIDLDRAVKATFGRDGWQLGKLKGFRLRGSLSLAHISVYSPRQ